jgi:DNA helicase HerA-like ATPase
MASARDFIDVDAFFDVPPPPEERLGVVVGGSLSKGLVVKLDRGQPVEELAVGRYVVVRGDNKRFFCMITDILLDNTNAEIQSDPPDITDPFLREVYMGTAAYGKIHVQPMLAIDNADGRPLPVKTIPGHFRNVVNATVEDVNDVFGAEDKRHFNVGAPLELETTQINLDLKRLVERSVGVFGKSGTGKSFLTRMLMAGIIAGEQAVSLIFDMHNDYGWEAVSEGETSRVKGLKQLFPADVAVCTLDPTSSRKRGLNPDFEVKIGFKEVEPEDIAMLRETMGMTDAMIDAAHALHKRWGKTWVMRLLNITAEDIEELEAHTPIREGTLMGLLRRLQRLQRWDFLVEETATDTVRNIVQMLQQKRSVVLEFGRWGNSLDAYILVANYITRRIHEEWVNSVEFALGNNAEKPPQLLITIEEAHKFLDPKIASQTIFGIIARELRKYNVTLLIVDQRPSGIDEEVMSQIGTRITALLDNERDINAVLTGISGAGGLREVLARLDTRQQAIIMGHAVPMPVVVKTRSYDEVFYKAISGQSAGNGAAASASSARDRLGSGGKRRL